MNKNFFQDNKLQPLNWFTLFVCFLIPLTVVQQYCYRVNAEKSNATTVIEPAFAGVSDPPTTPANGGKSRNKTLFFNQDFIEALYSHMDIDNIENVFEFVFSQLPSKVHVYPSENYYYFSFYSNGKWYWGNIRLGAEDRDQGMLSFAYYDYIDDPKTPHDSQTWFKKFKAEDGVNVEKVDSLKYSVSYKNKTTAFQLNSVEQVPPKLFKLDDDEVFLSKTVDESGFNFFLLFKKSFSHFMWILNEEDGIPGNLEELDDETVIDRFSGFVFYVDRSRDNRKILVGVKALNVRRNNYWDGPFDQLADNYLKPELAVYIQKAYPYTRHRINAFGIFTEGKGTRMAISSYHEYKSVEDMLETIQECKKQPDAEFLPCITYDYKTSF